MKIYNAVKTEEKAMEILQNWLNDNLTEENLSSQTTIRDVSARCECGETKALQAFFEAGDKIAMVAICDCCGDDNAMIRDVLTVI